MEQTVVNRISASKSTEKYLKRLEVDVGPTTTPELSHSGQGRPVVEEVRRISNPFSIDRILQPGPPPAGKRAADRSWNELTGRPVSYQQLSECFGGWHPNHISASAQQQFARPADIVNTHPDGISRFVCMYVCMCVCMLAYNSGTDRAIASKLSG